MKHFFIDLEGTIISPVIKWEDVELVNVDFISNLLNKEAPDSVSIFSFALNDKYEKNNFLQHVLPQIEKQLNIKINLIPTVEEIIQICDLKRPDGSPITFIELRKFFGKSGAFRLFVEKKFGQRFNKEHHLSCYLLDDEVKNELFTFQDLNISGKIINIDDLIN